MSTSPTIAEAVAALKAFADQLPQQPGLLVAPPVIGEPAPAEDIAYLRANPTRLPPDLVDLYELMNGCKIRWKFRDPTQPDERIDLYNMDGALIIPVLDRYTRLEPDLDQGDTFFGPGTRSVSFDEGQPHRNAWLVAIGPAGLLSNAERREYDPEDYADEQGEEYSAWAESAQADSTNPRLMLQTGREAYQLLPGTLADYLVQAVAHGCVLDWSLLWQGEDKDSDRGRKIGQQVERFRDSLSR